MDPECARQGVSGLISLLEPFTDNLGLQLQVNVLMYVFLGDGVDVRIGDDAPRAVFP